LIKHWYNDDENDDDDDDDDDDDIMTLIWWWYNDDINDDDLIATVNIWRCCWCNLLSSMNLCIVESWWDAQAFMISPSDGRIPHKHTYDIQSEVGSLKKIPLISKTVPHAYRVEL